MLGNSVRSFRLPHECAGSVTQLVKQYYAIVSSSPVGWEYRTGSR